MDIRLTHEGVGRGKTLMGLPVVVTSYLLPRWPTFALLGREAEVEAGVGELHEDGGGAEVQMLRQEVVPHFRVGQAAAVRVNADGLLVDGIA